MAATLQVKSGRSRLLPCLQVQVMPESPLEVVSSSRVLEAMLVKNLAHNSPSGLFHLFHQGATTKIPPRLPKIQLRHLSSPNKANS
jgi:hypothetical protein